MSQPNFDGPNPGGEPRLSSGQPGIGSAQPGWPGGEGAAPAPPGGPTDPILPPFAWYRGDSFIGGFGTVAVILDKSGGGHDLHLAIPFSPGAVPSIGINGMPIFDFGAFGPNIYGDLPHGGVPGPSEWAFLSDGSPWTMYVIMAIKTPLVPPIIATQTILGTANNEGTVAADVGMVMRKLTPADTFEVQQLDGAPAPPSPLVSSQGPVVPGSYQKHKMVFGGGAGLDLDWSISPAGLSSTVASVAPSAAAPTHVFHLGGNPGFADPLGAFVAEVLIYDSLLSAPDQTHNDAYLLARYGL